MKRYFDLLAVAGFSLVLTSALIMTKMADLASISWLAALSPLLLAFGLWAAMLLLVLLLRFICAVGR